MKKIIITSVSAGSGHVSAGNAVIHYLKEEHIVQHYDILQFSNPLFKKIYSEYYLSLISYFPCLWKLLYQLTDKPSFKFNQKTRELIQYLNHKKLVQFILKENPDIVISTHFMPPEILLNIKKKYHKKFKILSVITDFDVHYLWINKNIDHYFVAGEIAKNKLISYGINKEQITISGIPIMPQFFNPLTLETISQFQNKWMIKINSPVVLLMAGGAGIGDLKNITQNILDSQPHIQLIVLAGNNKSLLQKLNELSISYPNLKPIGFTKEVYELMAISDLVITKPGGLSTSECISMRKPMLLINPIPGQEEHNAHYLESLGIALYSKNIIYDLNNILTNLKEISHHYDLLSYYDSSSIIKNYLNTI